MVILDPKDGGMKIRREGGIPLCCHKDCKEDGTFHLYKETTNWFMGVFVCNRHAYAIQATKFDEQERELPYGIEP